MQYAPSSRLSNGLPPDRHSAIDNRQSTIPCTPYQYRTIEASKLWTLISFVLLEIILHPANRHVVFRSICTNSTCKQPSLFPFIFFSYSTFHFFHCFHCFHFFTVWACLGHVRARLVGRHPVADLVAALGVGQILRSLQ